MAIEITLLGTGSPMPDPDRAGPSTLVRAGGHTFLFDAGHAVGLRMAAAATAAPILSCGVAHPSAQRHITDLNDIITSRWVMSFVPNPLSIIGPSLDAGG